MGADERREVQAEGGLAEKVQTERPLTRTERLIIRCLAAQGGAVRDGYDSLSRATDSGLRSIHRAVASLRESGLLHGRRAGRRPALLTLTSAGSSYAASIGVLAQAEPGAAGSNSEQLATRPRQPISVPTGFVGDAAALNVARIVSRIGRSESPIDLAGTYLEHADPGELNRLLGHLDEYGYLPTETNPTQYALLDDGLRAHFARVAQRAAVRERILARANASPKPSRPEED